MSRPEKDPALTLMVLVVVFATAWACLWAEAETRHYDPLPCAAEHEGSYVLLWDEGYDAPRRGQCLRGYVRPEEGP